MPSIYSCDDLKMSEINRIRGAVKTPRKHLRRNTLQQQPADFSRGPGYISAIITTEINEHRANSHFFENSLVVKMGWALRKVKY